MNEKATENYFTVSQRALRTFRFFDCRLSGRYGDFAAMVVDISRSGALIRVLDTAFGGHDELNDLMAYTARVFCHFEDGVEIDFADKNVRATSKLIRVTADTGVNLIGVEFSEELTEAECGQLGIDAQRPMAEPVG